MNNYTKVWLAIVGMVLLVIAIMEASAYFFPLYFKNEHHALILGMSLAAIIIIVVPLYGGWVKRNWGIERRDLMPYLMESRIGKWIFYIWFFSMILMMLVDLFKIFKKE
jgi:hypothetical protein